MTKPGRPIGTGQGPSPNSRRKTVTVNMTHADHKRLKVEAAARGIAPATLAYQLMMKGLDDE